MKAAYTIRNDFATILADILSYFYNKKQLNIKMLYLCSGKIRIFMADHLADTTPWSSRKMQVRLIFSTQKIPSTLGTSPAKILAAVVNDLFLSRSIRKR